MKLSDFEKNPPLLAHDPIALTLQAKRGERVIMSTMYNADKDLTVEELKRVTMNNRLAFYGVPAAAAGAAIVGGSRGSGLCH